MFISLFVINKMSMINSKNVTKCNILKEHHSSSLSESISRRISFNKGEIIVKKNYEEEEQSHGGDEYWRRGPISARHCGTMLWTLHSCVSLEMTIDKSLRLVNYASNTVCAVNGDGESCAIIHATGVAYAEGDCVEVRGCDVVGKNDKYAKMTGKAIAFSSLKSGVVYVLDDAGIQTKSTEKMTNLCNDVSLKVFLKGCKCGKKYKKVAVGIIAESYYKLDKDGTQKWLANGVKISYTKAGVLDISKDERKVRVSMDMNGTVRVSTPRVNMAALGGKEPHFVVRKDNLKVTFNGSRVVAKNSRQAAGLDRDGLFRFFD